MPGSNTKGLMLFLNYTKLVMIIISSVGLLSKEDKNNFRKRLTRFMLFSYFSIASCLDTFFFF